MAESALNAPSPGWNIPPPGQRGSISFFTKLAVKRPALKARAIWVARPDAPKDRKVLDLLAETCREMGITDVPKLSIYLIVSLFLRERR